VQIIHSLPKAIHFTHCHIE